MRGLSLSSVFGAGDGAHGVDVIIFLACIVLVGILSIPGVRQVLDHLFPE